MCSAGRPRSPGATGSQQRLNTLNRFAALEPLVVFRRIHVYRQRGNRDGQFSNFGRVKFGQLTESSIRSPGYDFTKKIAPKNRRVSMAPTIRGNQNSGRPGGQPE